MSGKGALSDARRRSAPDPQTGVASVLVTFDGLRPHARRSGEPRRRSAGGGRRADPAIPARNRGALGGDTAGDGSCAVQRICGRPHRRRSGVARGAVPLQSRYGSRRGRAVACDAARLALAACRCLCPTARAFAPRRVTCCRLARSRRGTGSRRSDCRDWPRLALPRTPAGAWREPSYFSESSSTSKVRRAQEV